MYITLNNDGTIAQLSEVELDGSLPISVEVGRAIYAKRRIARPRPQGELPDVSYRIVDGKAVKVVRDSKAPLLPQVPDLSQPQYDDVDDELVIESVILELGKRVDNKSKETLLRLGILPGVDAIDDDAATIVYEQVEGELDLIEAIATVGKLALVYEPAKTYSERKPPAKVQRRKFKRRNKTATPKENDNTSNNGKANRRQKGD